jgi:IS30 family transposase
VTEQKTAWRHWTSEEEIQLRDMMDAGITEAEISLKLNRTKQAIYARLQRVYRLRRPKSAS